MTSIDSGNVLAEHSAKAQARNTIAPKRSKYDVCIIGAGVAGGVLAAFLGQNGKSVIVIERNFEEPDRIIGELLQPGGLQQLEAMGLEHLVDGFDAQEMEGYALFMNGNNFSIRYPESVTGRGFRNGKFIQSIRHYLHGLPNVELIEGRATELIEEGDGIKGVQYISNHDKQVKGIKASLTVSSDGMFSSFREKLSIDRKKVTGYFLGLILKDCKLPYPNHGHVIVTKSSPCLVYPISSTETRILIDFPGGTPPPKGEALVKVLKEELAEQLPQEIISSFNNAVDEGKFRFMPNHLIPAKPLRKPGVVLLGDSLNMRHPLTGGGMTVALTDVHSLGTKLLEQKNFNNTATLTKVVDEFYSQRSSKDATINILADALYNVMSNEELKKACYDYLKRGEKFASEPISILSAISRDVKLLLRHFFAVAIFGAKNILTPFPSPAKISRATGMIVSAVRIIFPLLKNEGFTKLVR